LQTDDDFAGGSEDVYLNRLAANWNVLFITWYAIYDLSNSSSASAIKVRKKVFDKNSGQMKGFVSDVPK
jgi:hypothetical protein